MHMTILDSIPDILLSTAELEIGVIQLGIIPGEPDIACVHLVVSLILPGPVVTL